MGIIKYQKYLDSHIGDLSNKTVVITGANSGIGFYAARLLAFKGARIIMGCRNLGRAEEARKAIIEAIPHARIEILIYDQASLASIEQFAGELTAKYPLINGFVFNAGIFHPKKDAVTKDGYPLTIGTNYLGTFFYLNYCAHILPRWKILMSSASVRLPTGDISIRRLQHTLHRRKQLFTANMPFQKSL
ncbi:MAG TPA: SDR family NAD(P)-dependent oxidoreductase [Bacilli bacterium]|nr:SDR family NAD(P)-dependent oxidoreductase [Bacilli bacterium]HOH68384.1 SDR family NAD(P)-dependent oxidoreductase [Bacilli bacterium]